MEKIISKNDDQNTDVDVEYSDESRSRSSSSCDTKGDIVNKKSTDKMSHIILLSAAWCAKMKSGTKEGYYDVAEIVDRGGSGSRA
jgi:hypothetical protein